MRLSEIERKARSLGIPNTHTYLKEELVRLIQRKEGNKECFATSLRKNCQQMICCWRPDCVR